MKVRGVARLWSPFVPRRALFIPTKLHLVSGRQLVKGTGMRTIAARRKRNLMGYHMMDQVKRFINSATTNESVPSFCQFKETQPYSPSLCSHPNLQPHALFSSPLSLHHWDVDCHAIHLILRGVVGGDGSICPFPCRVHQ